MLSFRSCLVGFIFLSQLSLGYESSQYIGCFNDESNRAMEHEVDYRDDRTIDNCIEACQRRGYTFAGLQYSYNCFCGNSYDRYGLAAKESDSEPCQRSCVGNSSQICGGVYKNSVYSVCPPSRYGLNCEQECESFDCQPALCQYSIGTCLYEQCDRRNSYCKKDCYTLKADPREEPGRLNKIPDRQLNLFKDLTFSKAGTVSEVQYFAIRSGKVFVSFWRKVDNYDNWQFVGKILLTSPGSGLQKALIPQSNRVYVREGDTLAIHYPEQGEVVIYQEDRSLERTPGISSNNLKQMSYVDLYDLDWPHGYIIQVSYSSKSRAAAIHVTLDCITECVNCEAGFCNKETGECTQCMPGYLGNRCEQECTDGFYGIQCQGKCSPQCRDQPCEKFSLHGECPSNLCKPGYMRHNCTEECPDGTFGADCLGTCPNNCLQPVCVKTNGSCKDGRCQPGYNGEHCDTGCEDGFHGENCLQECSSHCKVKVDPCNKLSNIGECRVSGCDPGYMGNNCKTSCLDGYYGENCTAVCTGHCLHGACMKNSTDGQCPGNVCEVGYQGARCDQECSPGFYGMGCEAVCSDHCQFPPCIVTTGQCPQKACLEGYFGDDCTATSPVVMKSGLIIAVVVICVLLVLVSAAIAVYCILKRRKKQKGASGVVEQSVMLEIKQSTLSLEYTDKPSDPSDTVPQTSDENPENDAIYANDSASPTAIPVTELDSYIANLKQQKHGFEEEYNRLPNDTSSTSEAAIPELRGRNRYKNILPYNNNRVQLSKQGGDFLSQYINASFIKDYNDKQTYIAALAPTASTLTDFWRMIWEHNVHTIFMLTNLIEVGKLKSEQYWPKEKEVTYGEITVSKKYEQGIPEYTNRTLIVTQGDETRKLSQYQYTHWPDKSVPENVGGVYKLRELMNQCKSDGKPILVHCSAGVGRTGTFIALDILLEQAAKKGLVDVFQCVKQLRHQRLFMVQTQVQYQFLYEALCEILTVGVTTIPCAELSARLSHMTPEFKQQYDYLEKHRIQKISEGSEKDNDTPTDTGDDESKKAKGSSHLKTIRVMGYSPTLHYLAGQMPSPEQVGDFWHTIYTGKLHTVVCLEQSQTKWLPSADSELSVKGFEVTSTESTDKECGVLTTELSVTPTDDVVYANVTHSNKSVKVKVLQQTPVDNGSAHNPAQRLISLHLESKLSSKQGVNDEPLLVLCRDGFTECGMYLASCLLLEMADTEQQVDVFHTVTKIRKADSRFIASLEQYIQLHNTVERYIEQFQEYSNFK